MDIVTADTGRGHSGLEDRIETLQREFAALAVALSSASRELADVAEELRSRRQTQNVVPLDRGPRREPGRQSDILGEFLE